MKVLFKSFYLYFLGAAADLIRWSLETEIKRAARLGRDISAKRLALLSDLSYTFYAQFARLETDLKSSVNFL